MTGGTEKLQYLHNGISDFDEILHGDVDLSPDLDLINDKNCS